LIVGQISYWLLLSAVAGFLLAGLWMYIQEAVSLAQSWTQIAVNIGAGFFTGRWIGIIARAL
jgi:hypothetical protein